jgi:Protein of unknown function (DUF2778)
MTDAAATFHAVTSRGGGISFPGASRRIIRLLVGGVVVGLGTAAAAGAFVAAVALAAAWIVNTPLGINPDRNAKALLGPPVIALVDREPWSAIAEDLTGSAVIAGDPAEAATFETKWAFTMGLASPRTEAAPPVPPAEPARVVAALQPTGEGAPPVAAAPAEKRATTPLQAHNKSTPLLPEPDSRTAVYDIAAHTVYLPNGTRLEAHSGLGNKLDDPRYVNVRDRGPTPPNVYDLTLREQLFHDVRALRLNPVNGNGMYGRDGILAHTYMLGPNGESNGCVSFKDYPAFLRAYLRGEVERLGVVPHLGDTPWRTASDRRGPARRYADNIP